MNCKHEIKSITNYEPAAIPTHKRYAQTTGTNNRHKQQAQTTGTNNRHKQQAQTTGTNNRHKQQAQTTTASAIILNSKFYILN
ncbi:MAG: hypothetical protein LBQ31_05430 [Bacteroidales bacterium]|nr:hypothetical protein [Bacteroidales bacterium]